MTAALLVAALSVYRPVEVTRVPRGKPVEVVRVGTVRIDGNTRTGDRAILTLVPFAPGDPLPAAAEFAKLERRLLAKFARRFDVDAGRWPTVIVQGDAGGPFRDVLVRFP